MKSEVYFADSRQRYGTNLFSKLDKLFDKAGMPALIAPRDSVALKLHWGESGNLGFIPAQPVRAIIDRIKQAEGKSFITDTNTLYSGSRRNAIDNINTAVANGFSSAVVGAPIIVADGLYGHDYEEVEIGGKYFKSVKIASAIHHAKAMIVISHVKGHMATGMGGTLKNIGMGCAAPMGKQNMHSDVKPKVTAEDCTACGSCIKVCPMQCISRTPDKKAVIDQDKCIGCAECVVVCQFSAIEVNWESDSAVMQEKMAEYAKGALAGKSGKCGFFNFILNVTPDCDCCNWNDAPFTPDIGVLASTDPVAIDQAAADLVNKAPWINAGHKLKKPKETDKFIALHDIDWTVQIKYAESLGLGSRDYTLIEVT